MKFKILLFTFFVGFMPGIGYGQQLKVTGKVTDQSTGDALPGVNIVIKGSTSGTVSDADGKYSINAAQGSVLVFSFVGFASQEATVGSETEININLESDLTSLQEVVVTGYTTQKKKDLTGAVAPVDLKEIKDQPSGNIMKNLQGRVAGVFVTGNGRPGDGGATVRIRGTSSPFSNSDPLYIIDGVPTQGGMHEINSNDIESFQVLKDASAASIYGARAANGVIIITTKKGSSEGAKINFRSNWSVQQFTSEMDPLNTEQRAQIYWQARVNDGNVGDNTNINTNLYTFDWNEDYANPVLNKIYLPEFIDAQSTMRPSNTDWFKEVTEASLMQDYNLSVSDGSQRGNYLFSLGYFNHDGVVKESNFTRISARLNSEYKLLDGKVKIGENLMFTNQRANQVNDEAPNIMWLSLTQQTIMPIHTTDGVGWGGPVAGMTDRDNPVRLIEDKKQNVSHFNRIMGNTFLEIVPVENLTLRTSLGVDYNFFNYRILDKAFQAGTISGEAKLTNLTNRYGSLIWTNTAAYNLVKQKHSAQFLLGTESIKYQQEDFSGSIKGFSSQDYNYTYLSNGTESPQVAGFGTNYVLQSYFAKVDYAFNDKYLASLTLRRDGSSRFGENNRYGNFPAASVGWRIGDEIFMNGISDIVSELKIRASWGQNGNQAIDDRAIFNIYRSVYATQSLFTDKQDNGTAYDIGGNDQGTLPSGYARIQSASPDLKWETTTQVNFGIDFGFLNSKFTGSVDYYVKQTTDFLLLKQGLATQGEGANQWVNVAGVSENKGVEFALNYRDNFGGLKVNLSANVTANRAEAKDLPAEIISRYPGNGAEKNINGRPFNSIYGYVTDGLFQNDEDVASHAVQSGAAPGRIKYRDLDGNGVIDQNDQEFIGVPLPDFTYGLNADLGYGNFDFNIFFQGISGGVLKNDQRIYTDFASQWVGANWGKRLMDAWTPENSASSIPALTLVDNNNEGRTSTYYLENQSYLKLRNVSIGYTLPREVAQKVRMTNARVFIQGQNLLTIKSKNSTIPDPETPNGQFPIPRVYTMGLNLTF